MCLNNKNPTQPIGFFLAIKTPSCLALIVGCLALERLYMVVYYPLQQMTHGLPYRLSKNQLQRMVMLCYQKH